MSKNKVLLFLTFNTDGLGDDLNLLEIAYWMGREEDYRKEDVKHHILVPYESTGEERDDWDVNFWESMNEYVYKMHEKSGLMEEVKNTAYATSNIHTVSRDMSDYIVARGKELDVNLGKVLLTTNNVTFARQCLRALYDEVTEVPFPSEHKYVSGIKTKHQTEFRVVVPDDISHQTIDITTLLLMVGGMDFLVRVAGMSKRPETERALDVLHHRATTYLSISKIMGWMTEFSEEWREQYKSDGVVTKEHVDVASFLTYVNAAKTGGTNADR